MDLTHLDRLWFLLLVPLLYLLARPPRPRASVLTPHLAQWQAALERVRRRPMRFERLRFWLLVAATAALVLAAAGPTVGRRPGPDTCVVLVDGSASMLAPGTRDEALLAFDEVLERVPQHVRVRAVLGSVAPVVVDLPDRASIRGAMERLLDDPERFDAGTDLVAFATRAREEGRVRVWTVTDGLGPVRAEELPEACSVVGAERPGNRAIARCDVRDAWPLPFVDLEVEILAAYVAADASDEMRSQAIRIRLGASTADDGTPVEPVLERLVGRFEDAGRGMRAAVTTRLRRPPNHRGPVVLDVSLDGSDGFALDDGFRVELPALPMPDVVLLAADVGERRSARAVAVAETLAELGGGRVVPESSARAGFVVTDGGRLETLPPRGILFGTRIADADPGAGREVAAPRRVDPVVVDWARDDALLAGVDLSELRVSAAIPLPDDLAGAVPLIHGDRGPLALAVPRPGGARTVRFGFELEDSNLALLAALPQILRRAYRAAWGDEARPRDVLSAGAGVSARPAESVFVGGGTRGSRPIGAFSDPGWSLTVPLALLALLVLAARSWC